MEKPHDFYELSDPLQKLIVTPAGNSFNDMKGKHNDYQHHYYAGFSGVRT